MLLLRSKLRLAFGRCADGIAARAMPSRKGDVLLLAETISKSHDGDKILFSGLTFSVV